MTSTNATSSNTESDTATDTAWITAESVDTALEVIGIPATGRTWTEVAPLMRDAASHGVPVCLTGGASRGAERLWAAAALRHGHMCIMLVPPTPSSSSLTTPSKNTGAWPAASECGGGGPLRHRAKCVALPADNDAIVDTAAVEGARAVLGAHHSALAHPEAVVRGSCLVSEAGALYIVGWLSEQGGDDSERAGQALADLRGAAAWPAVLMATKWRAKHGNDEPIPVYLYCLERGAWLECVATDGGEFVWRRRLGARPPPRPSGCYAVAGAPRITVMAGLAIEALYAQAPDEE